MKKMQDEGNSLRLQRDDLKAKHLKNPLSVTAKDGLFLYWN